MTSIMNLLDDEFDDHDCDDINIENSSVQSNDHDGTSSSSTSPSTPAAAINRIVSSSCKDLASDKSTNPVQPVVVFPVTMFGKVGRAFQERWYQQYPWLEYSVALDAAFCFACRFFHTNPDVALTSVGFRDWKHA